MSATAPINQSNLEDAIEMTLDRVVMEKNTTTTHAATGAYTTVGNYDRKAEGVLSIAALVAGTIQSKRSGTRTAIVGMAGSFQTTEAGNPIYTLEIHKNGTVQTGILIQRTLGGANTYGSFGARGAVSVVLDDTLEIKILSSGGGGTVTFQDLSLSIEWLD